MMNKVNDYVIYNMARMMSVYSFSYEEDAVEACRLLNEYTISIGQRPMYGWKLRQDIVEKKETRV